MDELELLPLSPALAHEIAAYRATFPADRMRVTLYPDRIPGLDHLEEYETAVETIFNDYNTLL